ncbi:MAG TPA: thiamine pyrophosphate-binding protein, partial [Bacteroidia bacterium]|nr:thiamine pyrophosphate-binding protein [Bacteroidia bacterium]
IQIPVITSLLAVDAVSFKNPLRAGFIGSYGNRWANLSIGNSDCLLILGSRLDIRQTGADVDGFKSNKKIIHVDIEDGELNNRVKDCYTVKADVNSFLQQAISYFSIHKLNTGPDWINEINLLKEKWIDTKEITNIQGINPNSFIHQLSKASALSHGYCVDVGSHQMWAAQSIELGEEQFFITSGGMGAMGYSLPAAIGACFASGKKPVVIISGDGGFQLNIQELQTIKRNQLPVKIIVLNNQSLGMIRQFQDSYFEGRHQSTVWGYSAPDFSKVAIAYGIEAATISKEEEIKNALNAVWKNPQSPFLLQVMIDPAANAYPKIAFGKPITEMEPFSKPIDMEGT